MIAPTAPVREGDIVYTSGGTSVRLTREIGGGGEGTVFLADDHGCAKIYHPDKRTLDRHAKIQAMLARPPRAHIDPVNPAVAWPTTAVYADPRQAKFVGFLMPIVDPVRYLPLSRYLTDDDRLRANLTWTDDDFLRVAHNLCAIVSAIHAQGHALGDINDQNILVTRTGIVAFVDCDSFQIRGESDLFPTTVGRQEYTSPELLKSGRFDEGGELSDRFGLATLVFRVLVNGYFPYEGRGRALENSPTTAEKISLGMFPYVSTDPQQLQPPRGASPHWHAVDHRIQQLMIAAFVSGHGRPDMRPAPSDWQREIRAVIDIPSAETLAPAARPQPAPRTTNPNGAQTFPQPAAATIPISYTLDKWACASTLLIVVYVFFQDIAVANKAWISAGALGMWYWFMRANYTRQGAAQNLPDYLGQVWGDTP